MTAVAAALGVWSNRGQSYAVEYGKPKDHGRNNHQKNAGGGRGNFDGRRGGTGYEYGHTVQYRHSALWSNLTGQIVQTGPEMQSATARATAALSGVLSTSTSGAELVCADTGNMSASLEAGVLAGDVALVMAFRETSALAITVPTSTTVIFGVVPVSGSWDGIVFGESQGFFMITDSSASLCYTSTDGLTWASQSGYVSNGGAGRLSYANGIFFSCRPASTQIRYSYDGAVWGTLDLTNGLSRIVYGNGVFVGFNNSGNVRVSLDPLNWGQEISLGWTVNGLGFGGGKFVAIPSTGTSCATSVDGVNWTTTTTFPTGTGGAAPVYGNGAFVCRTSASTATLYRSTDGVTWTTPTLPTAQTLQNLVFGNGKFVAFGDTEIITSFDGITWTLVTVASFTRTGVAYGNGVFVSPSTLTSSTRVYPLSHDTYTTLDSSSGTAVSSVLAYTTLSRSGVQDIPGFINATSVAVAVYRKLDATTPTLTYSVTGGTGTTITLPAATTTGANPVVCFAAHKSSDVSFSSVTYSAQQVTMSGNDGVNYVSYGGGIYFAAAMNTNTMFTSSDGLTWGTATLPSTTTWGAACYGGGVYVVLAQSGTSAASSTNGTSWTARTLPTSATWIRVTYGGGKFVAVSFGGTAAAYSTDGVTWQSATLPSAANWACLAYGNGLFVAATANGPSNVYATSPDGINWTGRTLPAAGDYVALAYGAGRFVLLARTSGNDYTSTDGTNWTQLGSAVPGEVNGVEYGGNGFLAVYNNSASAATSPDGLTWTARTVPTSATRHGPAYGGNGNWVATSNGTNASTYFTYAEGQSVPVLRASQVDAVDAIAIYDSAGPAV